MKKRMMVFALRWVLWRIFAWWGASLKVRYMNYGSFEDLKNSGKKYVVAFWHGSMFAGWFLHRPEGNSRMSALVSQSNDGEYLSTVLERWGYSMIRGSSHIGGKEAMQLMVDALNGGSSLAMTPDGPRGPRHELKMGALRAAQRTSVPLVLVGIAMERKRYLRSWDRFEVPHPFSTIVVNYSNPILVPQDCLGEPLDALKHELQTQMQGLTVEAERELLSKGERS